MARIYVASSWRNPRQPAIVAQLRDSGHAVYDFRNPSPGNHGFAWSSIDPDWLSWDPARFRDALRHPVAVAGFAADHAAMEWADTFLLVLPCGRSAHLELGWACGAGKRTIILLDQQQEPELMYLEAQHLCLTMPEALAVLASPAPESKALPNDYLIPQVRGVMNRVVELMASATADRDTEADWEALAAAMLPLREWIASGEESAHG